MPNYLRLSVPTLCTRNGDFFSCRAGVEPFFLFLTEGQPLNHSLVPAALRLAGISDKENSIFYFLRFLLVGFLFSFFSFPFFCHKSYPKFFLPYYMAYRFLITFSYTLFYFIFWQHDLRVVQKLFFAYNDYFRSWVFWVG